MVKSIQFLTKKDIKINLLEAIGFGLVIVLALNLLNISFDEEARLSKEVLNNLCVNATGDPEAKFVSLNNQSEDFGTLTTEIVCKFTTTRGDEATFITEIRSKSV